MLACWNLLFEAKSTRIPLRLCPPRPMLQSRKGRTAALVQTLVTFAHESYVDIRTVSCFCECILQLGETQWQSHALPRTITNSFPSGITNYASLVPTFYPHPPRGPCRRRGRQS